MTDERRKNFREALQMLNEAMGGKRTIVAEPEHKTAGVKPRPAMSEQEAFRTLVKKP